MREPLVKGLLAVLWSLSLLAPALARDTELHLPLADVLAMPEAKQKLDGTVKFYLAGQPKPKVLESIATHVSNRKTNGVSKSDVDGCRWAALSALIVFQEKAKSIGANAVVDIVSYYKKNEVKSATDYECHAGAMIIGVALKGDFVKVEP